MLIRKIELKSLNLIYRIGHKLGKKDKDITRKLLNQPIRTIPSLTEDISHFLDNKKPMLLARLGGTEGSIAGQYCEMQLSLRKKYNEDTLNWFFTTSGFFADDYEDVEIAVNQYAEMTLDGLKECDFLSATFPPKVYIPYFFKYYAQNAVSTFSDFGPYPSIKTEETWVRALKGKKVLVINSFADSIEQQFKRKELLVKSKEYELPDFELITYKTFVTQTGERPDGYHNFFEVLNKMISDIKQIDFDVALIGAGAYGFPMAVEIKRMGRIAIETCGKTPAFFGVYGERDIKDGMKEYMTEAWIRPTETPPKRFKEIENGCYW